MSSSLALTEFWERVRRRELTKLLAELSEFGANLVLLWRRLNQGPLNPVLLFLGLFENTKENLKNTKDFSHLPNP